MREKTLYRIKSGLDTDRVNNPPHLSGTERSPGYGALVLKLGQCWANRQLVPADTDEEKLSKLEDKVDKLIYH